MNRNAIQKKARKSNSISRPSRKWSRSSASTDDFIEDGNEMAFEMNEGGDREDDESNREYVFEDNENRGEAVFENEGGGESYFEDESEENGDVQPVIQVLEIASKRKRGRPRAVDLVANTHVSIIGITLGQAKQTVKLPQM